VTDVGRNDPCPCGSGRKFKRCCLGKDGSTGQPFTMAERESALAELFHFAHRPEFEAEHDVADGEFWEDRFDDLPDEEAEELEALDPDERAYHLWFAFDFVLESGHTVAELFLEREGSRLRTGEREYLERMRRTHLRLYEVVEVRPDEGLRLVDLWTEERLWVRERLATRQLVRWDLLAVRTMPGAEGDLVLEGVPYVFAAGDREDLLQELRDDHRAFLRKNPRGDLTDFFKQAGALFHQLWLDYTALRPPPPILTPEGDPVELATVAFDVRDGAAVARALAGHPDLETQDDGSYVWTEPEPLPGDPDRRSPDTAGGIVITAQPWRPGEEPRRSLGTIVLDGELVRFEATSRPRAARGRGFLEGLLGRAIRFREVTYRDVDEAIEEEADADRAAADEVPPEVQAELAAQFFDAHYRRWPDMPLPALGHYTPREAAGLDAERPALVALLKDMESRAERERREGRPAYDFGWLWAELGIPRPG
jgi:SEC-C motif